MLNGVLNIYKEKSYTSHDVVAKMRGILRQKKIGHTGTLDPDAQGVLPVCLGQATKLCQFLTDHDKVYQAVMRLGIETDTQDLSGQILAQREVICSKEEVETAVLSFIGPYDQIPPMYSALKVDGKRLYDLARQGKVVERKARPVSIHKIEIEEINLPKVTMTVHCSKGTYIRTLCHDIGKTLGCGAAMESLLRLQAGPFTMENSITLSQLETVRDEGKLDEYIISVEQLLSNYPKAVTRPETDHLIYNGNPVKSFHVTIKEQVEAGELVRMYDSQSCFLGLYEYEREKQRFKPQKMFLEQTP